MRTQSKMAFVIIIGVLHLVSGIAGIALGGVPMAVGWTLVIVGLMLVSLAWLALREDDAIPR
jgi:hypothetical protein